MKLKSQIEVMQSVRKPALPQNKVEQPKRGGRYVRKSKWGNKWD